MEVLHSICQQIWKTQQWPEDWKRSVFIPIPRKGNAKECSNYHTIALTAKDGEALYSQQKQDWELTVAPILIVKFRLKLKKLGKTTRPFSYDINQIPFDYTVEVTHRFKGLDLIDRVPEEL